ncbi:FxSxx-COOH system tetratricopeptide repeat protein [Geodermatophilus sp. SYSU D00814]
MRFGVLGPVEIADGARPIELRSEKRRILIAVLLCHANTAVPVDQLIEALWESNPPRTAADNVRLHVYHLRREMRDAQRIRHRPPGYLLTMHPEELDAESFTALTAAGRAALARGEAARAAELLRGGLSLWRGPAFGDLGHLAGLRVRATRLQRAREAALEARVEADLALGEHSDLIAELSELVTQFPLRERLRAQLMLALYRSGRQAEALQEYQRTRRDLAQDLGVDPSRPLQELEAAILAHDPGLDWTPPSVGSSARANEPRRPGGPTGGAPGQGAGQLEAWNVPGRNPHFIGREGELARLHERLHASKSLMAQALFGLGGVGKTQLAIEYAHRFAADYDVVWWIDAGQPILIPEQLAGLATRLRLPTGPTVTDAVDRLLAELRGRNRWLLIFDNAERPQDVAAYRPDGSGHLLITSRSPGWGALGGRLEVDVLTRAETVALLQARISALTEEAAAELAAELGDLPLAAAQAAAFLEQTGLPAADYLRRFRTHRATLLARGEVLGYQGRVDTTWALSLERLRGKDPAAIQLLELAAYLAPEPIPLALIGSHTQSLVEPLRSAAADPDALADTVGALVGYSLARRHPDGFQVHRLVQAVIRQQLPSDRQRVIAQQVVALLTAAAPGDAENPVNWALHAQLAPHVLTAAPLGDTSSAGRQLVLETARYLRAKGDSPASRTVCEQLLDRWQSMLGPDHADTLTAASILTHSLVAVGGADQARVLGRDTLQRCRRVLGPDHATALRAAIALALALIGLGETVAAQHLGEDTLERCRRVLGPDHATTLEAAATLTGLHASLGEVEPARALGEDTLERCGRVLGPDHATTLEAAAALTGTLARIGELAAARHLGEDTLERCRRVVGPDHFLTLWTADALAVAQTFMGEVESARVLSEDTLQHCRRLHGQDHFLTLWAAATLSIALTEAGEAESARVLGQDTLQRSRQLLGANHATTVVGAVALMHASVQLGEVASAQVLGEDTLQRARRVFGPDHAIALWTAVALTEVHKLLDQAEPARALGEDTLRRCRRVLGPSHRMTEHLERVIRYSSSMRGGNDAESRLD